MADTAGEAFGSSLIRALLLLLQSNRLIISTGDCIRDCYRDVIGGTFCCTILGKQDGSIPLATSQPPVSFE